MCEMATIYINYQDAMQNGNMQDADKYENWEASKTAQKRIQAKSDPFTEVIGSSSEYDIGLID